MATFLVRGFGPASGLFDLLPFIIVEKQWTMIISLRQKGRHDLSRDGVWPRKEMEGWHTLPIRRQALT